MHFTRDQYRQIITHPDGGITIDLIADCHVQSQVVSRNTQAPIGLARLWCKPSTFPAFITELENQGYTSNGQWVGTDRELCALYIFLKNERHIPASVSLPKFWGAIKQTFAIRWAHHNQIARFADCDYQDELTRLEDIFPSKE